MKKNQKLFSSPSNRSNTFEELLQEFPSDLVESAKEFEAFQRPRKVKDVAQLFQMVLLYCGLDLSLRATAGTLTLLGTSISDQAVSDRLSGCVGWLSHLLKEMLPALAASVRHEIGGRWILIDGSTVQVRGARGTSYRIHLGWDWVTQRIVEMKITDVRTGESLKLYEIQVGDVAIADRGYARFNDLSYVLEKGGNVIVRFAPHILPLLDEAGEAFKLADELWATKEPIFSKEVVMKKDKYKQVLYLHCFRLPPKQASEAKRKKRAKAKKDGRKLKKETLEYAEWTMILTSLEPSQVSAEEIGRIYRLRWQIEIVIKRLKSVLEIDKLRSKMGSKLSEVYLLGKSLYALLIAKRAGKLKETQEIEWRVWGLIKEQVSPIITQVRNWKEEYCELAINQLRERKRRRKRQSQLATELITPLFSNT